MYETLEHWKVYKQEKELQAKIAKEFKLNEWKKDYPNTHVLGSIVEYLKGVGHAVEEDVGKLCKT